jgi:hypothetical protein
MSVSSGTSTPTPAVTTYQWYDPRRRDTALGYVLLALLILLLILWLEGRIITTPVVVDTRVGQLTATAISQPAFGPGDEKSASPIPSATPTLEPTETPGPTATPLVAVPGGAGDEDAP